MNDMTGDSLTKRIWVWLASEGGYSSTGEIAEAVAESRKRVDNAMWNLSARGYFERKEDPTRKNGVGYGVTLACKVPQNVTLRELAALGLIRVEAAA